MMLRRFATSASHLAIRPVAPQLPVVAPTMKAMAGSRRCFSEYEGQHVKDDELVKKSDDWAIEETNFCLGRISFVRYKETDDLARRTQHLMDTQLSKQHTRLRDGTCSDDPPFLPPPLRLPQPWLGQKVDGSWKF